MTTLYQFYKCEKCGTTVEITHGGPCTPECCSQPMNLLTEKTANSSTEKHVPVALDGKYGVKVAVGSTPHPMTNDHFIEWIEVINGDYVNRKYLKPGDLPEAEFYTPNHSQLIIRSYCNLHGLWKA